MEVIVLAGGLGTRLQSVLHEIPKCLAPIGSPEEQGFPEAKENADASGKPCSSGRPFLGHLLDWLVGQGATHVVFSVGYLREQVMDYVKGREWPFEYHFAIEATPLGTGGGIRLALAQCRENQVFVVNGDTFFPVNLNTLTFNAPITVALKPMQHFDRYGAVSVQPASAEAHGIGKNIFPGGTGKTIFPEAIANPTHAEAVSASAVRAAQDFPSAFRSHAKIRRQAMRSPSV